MSFLDNMSMGKKISLIVFVLFILGVVAIISFNAYREKEQIKTSLMRQSKAVLLQAESMRSITAELNEKGAFKSYIDELKKDIVSGDSSRKSSSLQKFLQTVPVVNAMVMLAKNADEGGYLMRVPKNQPRNPENQPDSVEKTVLSILERTGQKEHVEFGEFKDPKTGKERPVLRYFRPIVLTKECETCHGDPATSKELWGNDSGLDPTGVKMENWRTGEVHGAFELIYFLDPYYASLRNSQIIIISGTLLGVIAMFALLTWFFKSVLSAPLDIIISHAKQIASGNLAHDIDVKSSDEIGKLGLAFKDMQQSLKAVIGTVTHSSSEVSGSSDALLHSSENMMSQSTESATSARHAANVSLEASDNINSIAAAVEEFSVASQEIASNVVKAASISNTAKAKMDESGDAVIQLGEHSQQIGKAIKLISDIAEQTNLLALNATIEAARAGEAGKGFAVVANEVKELAKQTAQAAEEITAMVQTIQDGSSGAVNAIADVRHIIDQLNDIDNTIASAVEEQTVTVNEITRNITNAASGTKEVSRVIDGVAALSEATSESVKQSIAQAQKLARMAEELKKITLSFRL